jgi:hypothetical protein
MHSGLCTLIGIREKPGGREKANRGRKRKRKRRRKGREKKKKKKDASGQYGCVFVSIEN